MAAFELEVVIVYVIIVWYGVSRRDLLEIFCKVIVIVVVNG